MAFRKIHPLGGFTEDEDLDINFGAASFGVLRDAIACFGFADSAMVNKFFYLPLFIFFPFEVTDVVFGEAEDVDDTGATFLGTGILTLGANTDTEFSIVGYFIIYLLLFSLVPFLTTGLNFGFLDIEDAVAFFNLQVLTLKPYLMVKMLILIQDLSFLLLN